MNDEVESVGDGVKDAIEVDDALLIVVRLKIIFEREVDDVCRNGSEEEDDAEVTNEGRANELVEAGEEILKERV